LSIIVVELLNILCIDVCIHGADGAPMSPGPFERWSGGVAQIGIDRREPGRENANKVTPELLEVFAARLHPPLRNCEFAGLQIPFTTYEQLSLRSVCHGPSFELHLQDR
jgi:hypothetical protein